MSNVLYTCSGTKDPEHPEDSDCGSRLFAAPGGSSAKCRHHPEGKYVQREDAPGILFTYTDQKGKGAGEGAKAISPSGTKPIGDVNAKGVAPLPARVTAMGDNDVNEAGKIITVVDPDDLPTDLRGLRQAYELVFGEAADRRFRETKLTVMISAELERQAEEEHGDMRTFNPESRDVDMEVENGEEEE